LCGGSSSGNSGTIVADGLTLSLAVLLLIDGLVLLAAGIVQVTGARWLMLQPMADLREDPMAPVFLMLCACVAFTLSGACFWAGCDQHAFRALWARRVPALASEAILCAHSLVATLAALELWGGGAWAQPPTSTNSASSRGAADPIVLIFAHPSSTSGARVAFAIALASQICTTALALALPAVRNAQQVSGMGDRTGYEVVAVLLLALALSLGAYTHVHATRADHKLSSRAIRALLLATVVLSGWSAVCFVYTISGSSAVVMLKTSAFPPGGFVALLSGGILLFIHAPGIGVFSSVCYEDKAISGLTPPNVPREARRRRGVGALVLACIVSAVSLSCVFFALLSVRIEHIEPSAVDFGTEPDVEIAEICHLYFNVQGTRREDSRLEQLRWTEADGRARRANLYSEHGSVANLESEAAQLVHLRLCEYLQQPPPSSPLHSQFRPPECLYLALAHWVRANNSATYPAAAFPIPQQLFPLVLKEFLLLPEHFWYNNIVGFRSEPSMTHHLAWLTIGVKSKSSMSTIQMLSNPDVLEAYMNSWTAWFERLPLELRGISDGAGSSTAGGGTAGGDALASAESSVLRAGWPLCGEWENLSTLRLFVSGIMRSIFVTPLFCLFALSTFVGDIITCYAALWTVRCSDTAHRSCGSTHRSPRPLLRASTNRPTFAWSKCGR
jgi:hypothetical protein